MRAWKIHLGWGLVAVVSAGAWGRWTAARHGANADDRGAPEAAAPEESPQAQAAPSPTVNSPRPNLAPSSLQLLPDPLDQPADAIRARMKSSNVEDAYQAMDLIRQVKDSGLKRDLLLEGLHSSHWELRRNAMAGLVEEMGADAVPIVQGILASDAEISVRSYAAELLGGFPDKGSAELLMTSYRTGDDSLKVSSAAALYRLGNPAPAAELLPGMAADLDSPDGYVRKAAVDRIAKLQVPMAIPILARALRDSSGIVRAKAVIALGGLDAPEVPDLLEPLLQDSFIDARDNAKYTIDAYRLRHPK
jgi:HEAT repeat protein